MLFLPAVLGALNLQGLLAPVQGILNEFLGFLPNLLAAGLIGFIGWCVARIVRQIVTSLLAAAGGDRLSDRLGIAPLSAVVGLIVYALIIMFSVFEASSLLGFNVLSEIMKELTVLGGHILLGLVIFALGLYLANLASKTIQTSGNAQAGLLTGLARMAIILLSGSIAIRYMGLANEIINLAFGLIRGAQTVAVALAFGIGGRDIAARKLEEWINSQKSE